VARLARRLVSPVLSCRELKSTSQQATGGRGGKKRVKDADGDEALLRMTFLSQLGGWMDGTDVAGREVGVSCWCVCLSQTSPGLSLCMKICAC